MQKELMLVQHKYITDLLKKFGMQHSNHYSRSAEESTHLHSKKDLDVTDTNEYQNLVGNLIFVTQTKPDLSYAVSVLSWFMTKPLQAHMKATKKILWYLQGTNNVGIFFPKKYDMQLVSYCDYD